MRRLFIFSFFICDVLLAGRFDSILLNSGSEEQLVQSLKSSTLDHPVHKAVATIYKGHDKFAGVYIGNRMLLTAGHCIDGYSAKGYKVAFTTYLKNKLDIVENVVTSAKVLTWKHLYNYELGERDYGIIILDRDPVGIEAVKIWSHSRKKLTLPNRDGIIISPIANIDLEVFHGYNSYSQGIYYTARSKHTYYTDLLFGNELPHAMKKQLDGPKTKILSSIMLQEPRYQTISNKIYGKTRTGDSGAPIFIKNNGEYYLVGLVSGGYYWANGVLARELADLYVHLGNWYRGGRTSLSALGQNTLKQRIAKEKRRIKNRRSRHKKLRTTYKKAAKNQRKILRNISKSGKSLTRYKNLISRYRLRYYQTIIKAKSTSPKNRKILLLKTKQLKAKLKIFKKKLDVTKFRTRQLNTRYNRSHKKHLKAKRNYLSHRNTVRILKLRLNSLMQGLKLFK